MKYSLPFVIVLFAMMSFGAHAQMNKVPGEMIVQFSANADPEKVVDDYGRLGNESTDLRVDRILSAHMRTYLLKYDPSLKSNNTLLEMLRRDEKVSIAQFNHYVTQRQNDTIVPNDLQFSGQWHHQNTGQNGGTMGSDIGSTQAWDITTGGLTATGDTIVVCVIEGGNLTHPDLQGNAWVNNGEIPGNGIDDDANGFVDDYLGWNVNSENDQGVLQGGHGTQVMGMIGATGDNELGVAGINWKIKIMSVAGENIFNEASVVAAYNYPLVQRKLYNESDGDRGAFVVATNASWGINQGNMEDVPIWNAFYDTLGVYGILNCGATANAPLNVDEVGDIPTGSTSPYMVSVTATNRNDVRTFSAFGATTIDLAAPGEDVLTTQGNQGYGTTSGTSFASPLTAGVIALLYSTPCPSLMELVKADPQLGADYIRYALMEGTDPIAGLEGFTVTGGRVNAYNSLNLLLENCGENICLPPFTFDYELTDDTLYTFTWTTIDSEGVALRYREVGEEEWIVLDNVDADEFEFVAENLCTNYEFEIASLCSAVDGEYVFGANRTFETKGCCIAPEEFDPNEIEENSVSLLWSTNFALDSYEVFYRVEGQSEWISADVSGSGALSVAGLEGCTFYEFLVQPVCADDFDLGTQITIRTAGCGHCIDTEFCESFGTETSFEYIGSIQIDDLLIETPSSEGYALIEDVGLEFETFGTYEMTVTPEYTGAAYDEFIRVWIDYNQDGEFSPDELVLSSTEPSSDPVSGEVSIPETAQLGNTRMRVAMKYIGFGTGTTVEACETFQDGETKDFCVEILEGTEPDSTVSTANHDQFGKFTLFPNPNSGAFAVEATAFGQAGMERPVIRVYDIAGRMIEQQMLTRDMTQIDLQSPENGIYLYSISNGDSGEVIFSDKFVIAR